MSAALLRRGHFNWTLKNDLCVCVCVLVCFKAIIAYQLYFMANFAQGVEVSPTLNLKEDFLLILITSYKRLRWRPPAEHRAALGTDTINAN